MSYLRAEKLKQSNLWVKCNEIKQGETLKIGGEWIYLEGEKRKEGFAGGGGES